MAKVAVIFSVLLLIFQMARAEKSLEEATTETPSTTEPAVDDEQFTTQATDLEKISDWTSTPEQQDATTIADEILLPHETITSTVVEDRIIVIAVNDSLNYTAAAAHEANIMLPSMAKNAANLQDGTIITDETTTLLAEESSSFFPSETTAEPITTEFSTAAVDNNAINEKIISANNPNGSQETATEIVILASNTAAPTRYLNFPSLFPRESNEEEKDSAEDSSESDEQIETTEISSSEEEEKGITASLLTTDEHESTATAMATDVTTTAKPKGKFNFDLPTIFKHLGNNASLQVEKKNVTLKINKLESQQQSSESASHELDESSEVLQYLKKKGVSIQAETVNFYITFIDKYNLKTKVQESKNKKRTKVSRSSNKM